ncbi:FAD synthase [Patescibacteria group bacterium]|nr:FAD synthase [Patescibacteria group bacterium]
MQPSSKKKLVMAFGTFDYFHAGHESYLSQASKLGDSLMVIVARDDTVKKVKNEKPTQSERKRLREVAACKYVDKAMLGSLDDKYRVIKKYRPDVIALGYDQFVFTYKLRPFLIKEKIDAQIIRLEAFRPSAFKSSILKNSTQKCDPEPQKIPAD